jgi:hypothetical protein
MRSATDARARRGWLVRGAGLAAFLGALLAGRLARAAGDSSTYGRIDGDVGFVVAAGAVVVRAEGELRIRYLETAGAFVAYEDGGALGSRAEPRRCLVAGLELRPLFLFRWLRGQELGNARLDLGVDSIGVELGAVWAQPDGRGFASTAGLQVALAVEIPITGQATGPWAAIRGGLRWSDDALASGVVATADDREAFVAITLAWHQLAAVHIVDLGDEAPR